MNHALRVSLVSAVAFSLIAILVLRCVNYVTFRDQYEAFESIEVGMREAAVIERLGEPVMDYGAGTDSTEYRIRGYEFPVREVTSRLLVYKKTEAITFIFIGPDGQVEEVFIGGS